MSIKLTSKIITIIEIIILLVALLLGGLWISDPNANYEPILVFLGFTLTVLEVVKRKSKVHEKNEGPKLKQHARRYLDQPHQVHFIQSLPRLKRVAEESSQQLWDSGITANMRQGSYDLIDFLKDNWVKLAEFYPPLHFDGKEPRDYISEYTKNRFSFHRANLEPNGPGTGGSIVHVMVGGDVIADLEKMIEETVCTLSLNSDSIEFIEWKQQWRGKA